MIERRRSHRTRARLPCTLTLLANGTRVSGYTRNISLAGAEFDAAGLLGRAGQEVEPGSAAVLGIGYVRAGSFDVLRLPCRIAYVQAGSAGVEFTSASSTQVERDVLRHMVETGSNRMD